MVILAMLLCVPGAEAQAKKRRQKAKTEQRAPAKKSQKSVETLRQDSRKAREEMEKTAGKLEGANRELSRQINRLNSLNADIDAGRSHARSLRTRIDSIGGAITETSDSLKMLEGQLEAMRRAYVKAMRDLQPHASQMGQIGFIFSSRSFSEAYSRLRYLQQFSAWRVRKADAIRETVDRVAERRERLSHLRHSQDVAYREAEKQQTQLASLQRESEQMVATLRKRNSALRAQLEQERRRAAALDRQIDRLIAEENARMEREEAARRKKQGSPSAKKPAPASASAKSSGKSAPAPSAAEVASAKAEVRTASAASLAALTGSFEANKGRLPFPVTGRYKIVRKFGRQPHPTLPHVQTENTGIDIETSQGAAVRSVYGGTVSFVIPRAEGYNAVVMVRHGRYLTVYGGLGSVKVKQGDKVAAGETIGAVFADPNDGGRSILHFEVRRERQKLNPVAWVR